MILAGSLGWTPLEVQAERTSSTQVEGLVSKMGYFEAVAALRQLFTAREVSNLMLAASEMSQSFHGVRVTCHREVESFSCTYKIDKE